MSTVSSSDIKGKIIAVCTSSVKGTKKKDVFQGILMENYGLLGDGHAETQSHRQLSLLALESIQKMRDLGLKVNPGDFAENITTEGIELAKLPIGTQIVLGQSSIVEITQIGKECHTQCEIGKQTGQCIKPTEGIFCRVLESGKIKVGDSLKVFKLTT